MTGINPVPNSKTTKHYLISGRVQGVGFRAFVRRLAGGLQVSGWTRNLHDGRVEVLVQGSSATLDLFEAKLKIGPVHGHVESVTMKVVDSPDAVYDFAIRKDGDGPCM